MPASPLPRIGFIGLGVMGAPMAGHLARAGYALSLLDADPQRSRLLMMKDIGIALDLARETSTPMPLSGLAQQLWRAADQMAGPGSSVSEIARWVERLARTEIAPRVAP